MEYREFRADTVGIDEDGKLYGRAVPFNRETIIGDLNRGGWHEEFAPGSTKKSINDGDVVFLAHHDMHMPLARMSAGNLTLREAGDGLDWEADPVDTSYGRDIRALAKAKVLGGVSVGFKPIKDEWRDDNGNPADRRTGTHRILREVKLIEISAVTNPAYKDTSIMARDELLAERESRAAKATYADLETCGECGATGQYGAYCSNCGKPMKQAKPSGGYCTSCGAKLDGKRDSDHQCERRSDGPYGNETYADPKNGKYPLTENGKLDSKRVHAAWSYISMPKNAAKYPLNGVSLSSVKSKIKAAAAKIGMQISDEKGDVEPDELRDPYKDSFYENEVDEDNERDQEPDTSTPDDDTDLALRMAMRQAMERSRELGFV